MIAESLNHYKSVLAHSFFVLPADKNYLAARWLRSAGLIEDFYWNALQSIEKYAKACLVLNGRSARGYGHDILRAVNDVRRLSDDLIPEKFTKPEKLNQDFWQDEDIDKFVQKIGRQGHPDSRYGLVSWAIFPSDLFKLDQLVFSLRRLTIGLDWVIGEDWPLSEELAPYRGSTYRRALTEMGEMQVRPFPEKWAKLRSDASGEMLTDVLHRWNFAFSRSEGDTHFTAPPTLTSPFEIANSALYRLAETLRRDRELPPHTREATEWLISNVPLATEDVGELRRLLAGRGAAES